MIVGPDVDPGAGAAAAMGDIQEEAGLGYGLKAVILTAAGHTPEGGGVAFGEGMDHRLGTGGSVLAVQAVDGGVLAVDGMEGVRIVSGMIAQDKLLVFLMVGGAVQAQLAHAGGGSELDVHAHQGAGGQKLIYVVGLQQVAGLGGENVKFLRIGGVLVVDGHVGPCEGQCVLHVQIEAAGAVFQHVLIAHLLYFPLAVPAAGVVHKGHLRACGAAAAQGQIGVVAGGDAVIIGAGNKGEGEDLVALAVPGIQHAAAAVAKRKLLVQNVAVIGKNSLDGEALAAGDGRRGGGGKGNGAADGQHGKETGQGTLGSELDAGEGGGNAEGRSRGLGSGVHGDGGVGSRHCCFLLNKVL